MDSSNPYLTQIKLENFRNHTYLVLNCINGYNVIYGDNGLGKTNILEAISFLTSSKGIRSSSTKETINEDNQQVWQLTFHVENSFLLREIKISVKLSEAGRYTKQLTVDGKTAKMGDICNCLGVSWLTPQMDRILTGEPAKLRNYFDRACFDLDTEHLSRLNEYDRLLKERQLLLLKDVVDYKWLEIVERHLAEVATAILLTRNETLAYLNNILCQNQSSFPVSGLSVEGKVEDIMLTEHSALGIETVYAQKLQEYRHLDQQNKQSNFGIHRSIFSVTYLDKNKNAKLCSTGEQKALLIGIEIARAKMRQQARKNYPILLLDEVMSHLDDKRRQAFIEEIDNIGSQCFLTGTEKGIFQGLEKYLATSPEKIQFVDLTSLLNNEQ